MKLDNLTMRAAELITVFSSLPLTEQGVHTQPISVLFRFTILFHSLDPQWISSPHVHTLFAVWSGSFTLIFSSTSKETHNGRTDGRTHPLIELRICIYSG